MDCGQAPNVHIDLSEKLIELTLFNTPLLSLSVRIVPLSYERAHLEMINLSILFFYFLFFKTGLNTISSMYLHFLNLP